MSLTSLGGYLEGKTRCYGFLHRPSVPTNLGVVIVNDFGYRGLCAYWAFRRLADRLAAEGATVLRFDLPGTGDSPALEGNRVEWWEKSADEAIAFVRSQPGIDEVLVIGFGIGATLALNAARRSELVKVAELIDPFVSGAHYLAALGPPTATRPPLGGRLVSDHFLSSTEVASLGALEAVLAPRSPPLELDVVTLDADAGRDFAQAAERAGAAVNLAFSGEGARLTTDPLYGHELPGFFDNIVERLLRRRPEARAGCLGEVRLQPRAECAERGYDEEAIAAEADGTALHGILTLPRASATPSALVFVFGTSANRRTGMHDNNTLWCRELATSGIAALRFDASGFGDSRPRGNSPDNETLVERNYSDAGAFLSEVRRRGFTQLGAMGLSSGGFNAFKFALGEPSFLGLFGINTARFVLESLEQYDRANVKTTDHYWAALRSPETWTKLLTGQVNARHIASALVSRLSAKTSTTIKLAAARLGRNDEIVLGQAHREMLDLLARPGCQVQLAYAVGDRHIEELEKHFGPRGDLLSKHPNCEVAFLPKMDHSMSAPSDAAKVGALAASFFTRALGQRQTAVTEAALV